MTLLNAYRVRWFSSVVPLQVRRYTNTSLRSEYTTASMQAAVTWSIELNGRIRTLSRENCSFLLIGQMQGSMPPKFNQFAFLRYLYDCLRRRRIRPI